MKPWNDLSRRPALNIEEAALLPALPPRRMTGGAALKNALEGARSLEEKQVSSPVALSGPLPQAAGAAPRAAGRPVSRAALHQVLRPRSR